MPPETETGTATASGDAGDNSGADQTILDALQADEATEKTSAHSTDTDKPGDKAAESSESGQKSSAEEQGKGKDAEGKDAESKDGETKVLSADELSTLARKRLGLSITEPESVDYLKKKLSASSDEARKLVQRDKALSALLAEKGLKLTDTTDGPRFVGLDNWKPQNVEQTVSAISASMTQAEKDLAVDEPEKFAALVAKKTLESTSRSLEPTIRQEEVRIPDGIKPMLTLEVAGAKDTDGNDAHPDFTDLEPYIDARLDDPSTPAEFKDFMDRSPENFKFGKHLLYSEVHMRVAPLIAAQRDAQLQLDKKKKEAEDAVSLTDQGTNATSGKMAGGSSGKGEADEIVGAKEMW